jgi:hypothetical protein
VDDTIGVPMGGTAVLNVSITHRDGGMCANQDVQVLRVRKDSQADGFVYLCSNLNNFRTMPCSNSSRFTVAPLASSSLECKYNIRLEIRNFTESDVDVYTVEVNFDSIGDTTRRMLTRRIRFLLVDGKYISACKDP